MTCPYLYHIIRSSSKLCRALLPNLAADAIRPYLVAKARLRQPLLCSIIKSGALLFSAIDSVCRGKDCFLILVGKIIYSFKYEAHSFVQRAWQSNQLQELQICTDTTSDNCCFGVISTFQLPLQQEILNEIAQPITYLEKIAFDQIGSQRLWSVDGAMDVKLICFINGVHYMVCSDGIYELDGPRLIMKEDVIGACNSNTEIFLWTQRGVMSISPPSDKSRLLLTIPNVTLKYSDIMYREVDSVVANVRRQTKYLFIMCDDFMSIYRCRKQEYKHFAAYKAHPGSVYTSIAERFNSVILCASNMSSTFLLNIYNWSSNRPRKTKRRIKGKSTIVRVFINDDSVLFFEQEGNLVLYPLDKSLQ